MRLCVTFLSVLALPMVGIGAPTASVPKGFWSATKDATSYPNPGCKKGNQSWLFYSSGGLVADAL